MAQLPISHTKCKCPFFSWKTKKNQWNAQILILKWEHGQQLQSCWLNGVFQFFTSNTVCHLLENHKKVSSNTHAHTQTKRKNKKNTFTHNICVSGSVDVFHFIFTSIIHVVTERILDLSSIPPVEAKLLQPTRPPTFRKFKLRLDVRGFVKLTFSNFQKVISVQAGKLTHSQISPYINVKIFNWTVDEKNQTAMSGSFRFSFDAQLYLILWIFCDVSTETW